jgi:hypothetical protein
MQGDDPDFARVHAPSGRFDEDLEYYEIEGGVVFPENAAKRAG